MKYIEFDPENPTAFESFVCEDEKRINRNVMLISLGVFAIIIGVCVYASHQQKKKFEKSQSSKKI
jgi:hypothetical protein